MSEFIPHRNAISFQKQSAFLISCKGLVTQMDKRAGKNPSTPLKVWLSLFEDVIKKPVLVGGQMVPGCLREWQIHSFGISDTKSHYFHLEVLKTCICSF